MLVLFIISFVTIDFAIVNFVIIGLALFIFIAIITPSISYISLQSRDRRGFILLVSIQL